MSTATVRFHRVLRASRRGIAPFSMRAMAKWLPPFGFTCEVHHLEARVGGSFRMSPQLLDRAATFVRRIPRVGAEQAYSLHGHFRRPEPAGRNGGEALPLKPVSCGTELNIVRRNTGDDSA